MINLDTDLADEYLAESREHLADMERDLLALELNAGEIDDDLVNGIFRAVHSVKGGAGFFDLKNIRELAHQTEHALVLIRSGKMVPTPNRINVLLSATDRLRALIGNAGASNQADISATTAALAGLCVPEEVSTGQRGGSVACLPQQKNRNLRTLLVEDDFACRLVLQTFLSRYGECHVAMNGREAVEGFRSALEHGQNYDLICMDIMMPEMDGREAVRQIRALEEAQGVRSTCGATIIMTTAVDDIREVIRCFWELCDAYLVKPIDLGALLIRMKDFHLVE